MLLLPMLFSYIKDGFRTHNKFYCFIFFISDDFDDNYHHVLKNYVGKLILHNTALRINIHPNLGIKV